MPASGGLEEAHCQLASPVFGIIAPRGRGCPAVAHACTASESLDTAPAQCVTPTPHTRPAMGLKRVVLHCSCTHQSTAQPRAAKRPVGRPRKEREGFNHCARASAAPRCHAVVWRSAGGCSSHSRPPQGAGLAELGPPTAHAPCIPPPASSVHQSMHTMYTNPSPSRHACLARDRAPGLGAGRRWRARHQLFSWRASPPASSSPRFCIALASTSFLLPHRSRTADVLCPALPPCFIVSAGRRWRASRPASCASCLRCSRGRRR